MLEDQAARGTLHDYAPRCIRLEIERLRLRDDETVIRKRLRAESQAITIGAMALDDSGHSLAVRQFDVECRAEAIALPQDEAYRARELGWIKLHQDAGAYC